MRPDFPLETHVGEGETSNSGEHVEIDIREAMRQQFSTGRGVIQLQPGMTDEMILHMIKLAISVSDGKAFTVIPSLRTPTTS